MSRNCVSTRNCRHCNNRHHQSICDRTHNSPVNQNSSGGAERENGSKDDKKNQENVTTNTTNTSTYRRTVLLQTARAVAFDVIGLLQFECYSTTVASEAMLRTAYECGWDSRLTRKRR